MEQFKKFIQLVKVDEQTHMTWGIATSEVVDKDNEICSYVDAKKSYKKWADDYIAKTTAAGQDISMGNVRVMHGLEIGGKVIKLEFKDEEKQVWLGTQPADDRIWKLIKGGFVLGLSQGGKYLWKEKKGDVTWYAPEISEVSYVDAPCNPDASFAYVKADGSMELKKFVKELPPDTDPEIIKLLKDSEPAIPNAPGAIPATPTAIPDKPSADICSCACPECKSGNCAGCSQDTKCRMCMAAGKALLDSIDKKEKKKPGVKYLVTQGEYGYLPISRGGGKPDHGLMGAAWAALNSPGGHRGNKYQGPNKEEAKRKLKNLYAREGMETPSEKTARFTELIKNSLENAILSQHYGASLSKGMWNLSRFAEIVDGLCYLCMAIEQEGEIEGDDEEDFKVSENLSTALDSLLDSLVLYTSNQVDEIREHHGLLVE